MTFSRLVYHIHAILVVWAAAAETLNSTDYTSLRSWFGDAGRNSLAQPPQTNVVGFGPSVDYSFSRPFSSLPTEPTDGGDNWSTFGGHCCEIEMPVQSRGFLNSSTVIGDPLGRPLINMMTKMAKHNVTLVFWGDSVTVQTVYAFVAELRRECLLHNEPLPESITAEGKKEFELNSASTRGIVSMFRFLNVTIISFRQTAEGQPSAEEFMSAVARVYSTSIALFANMGLHLAKMAERIGKPGRQTMHNLLEQFILDVKHVKQLDENSVAFWMETTATHFNSRLGVFADWETPEGYNSATYNTWDPEFPLYHCRQHNESEAGLNRLENLLMYEIMQHQNLTQVLPVIEVHHHFAPHYRMHYGNCPSEGNFRVGLMDCTHFCAFSPLMWAPIWRQMEHSVHTELQKQPAFLHRHHAHRK